MSFLLKLVFFFFGMNFLFSDQCISTSISNHKQIEFCSQASQDKFVHFLLYELLGKQDDGYYLEIGAGHPQSGNNSYFFEKNLGWQGVSIDIDYGLKKIWYSLRKNSLLIQDALQTDYSSILKHFPQVIDYLSLDIDNDYDTVLEKIPFNEHVFKIITIEHDFYRFGEKYRKNEREILESLGYYLLCPDVSIFFNGKDSIFEDWWIYPSAFSEEALTMLISLDLKEKNHDQLIHIIQNCLTGKKNNFEKILTKD